MAASLRNGRGGEIATAEAPLAHVYVRSHCRAIVIERATLRFLAKNGDIIRRQDRPFARGAIRNLWCQVAFAHGCQRQWGAMGRNLLRVPKLPSGEWLRHCRWTFRRVRAALKQAAST